MISSGGVHIWFVGHNLPAYVDQQEPSGLLMYNARLDERKGLLRLLLELLDGGVAKLLSQRRVDAERVDGVSS